MPRRWHQVGGSISAGDGGKQARSPGRARRKPLKPLRGECRVEPGVTVVTMLVCFFILHARLRAHCAPGIPCALICFGWQDEKQNSGPRREIALVFVIYARGSLCTRVFIPPPFVERVAHRERSDTMCRVGACPGQR